MYGVVCIYNIESSSISGAAGRTVGGIAEREHEWLPWFEEVSVQEPLTLKMMQIDMLALLTS